MAVREPSRGLLRFAAQVRAARAILDWSQRELADQVGMTQKSIYRIERGDSDVRQSTMEAFEMIFAQHGITFQSKREGGFLLTVSDEAIQDNVPPPPLP